MQEESFNSTHSFEWFASPKQSPQVQQNLAVPAMPFGEANSSTPHGEPMGFFV